MTEARVDLSVHLPPGMNAEAFTTAVAGTGYPLQMYAAAELVGRRFWVHEEWAYTDRDEGARRAIDILAGRSGKSFASSAGASSVNVELIIECKQSQHPFVFFEAVKPPQQGDHPSPIYNPGKVKLRPAGTDVNDTGSWYSEVALGVALDVHRLPFIADTPVAASMSIARAQSKKVRMAGDEAYRELLLPLTKAGAEHRELRRAERNSTGAPQFIDVPFLVALLDAPMFLVRGPDVYPVPIKRLRMFVRDAVDPDQHRWAAPRIHFVEVVRRAAFVDFLDRELPEFMADLERRINDHHRVVLSGEAEVEDLSKGEVLDAGVLSRLRP